MISSPPLVAIFLIQHKGAESPGSGRMGVICHQSLIECQCAAALVNFSPSEDVRDKLHSP